jgi:hypothetical protein
MTSDLRLISLVAIFGISGLGRGQMGRAEEALRALEPIASAAPIDAAIDGIRVDAKAIEVAQAHGKPMRFRSDTQLGSFSERATPSTMSQDAGARGGVGGGEDESAKLAQQLQNPVAALISVPFQSNFEFGGGPNGDGFRYILNFQPVIPISISENWNLISRTIVPFISQHDMIGTTSQTGLGDITQSLFFSPKQPTKRGGIVWGAGPVFLVPSATDSLLGSEKLGIGPTIVALKQTEGWTFGVLANHIWSVAGDENRDDVSSTFLQPFINYTTKTHTTFGVGTESSYDWEHDQWTVPIIPFVSQLVKIGKMPVSFQLGAKYWAEGPDGTPDWGIRFAVVLLFPK